MKDILYSIKKVMVVFLLCFIGLISYITYFQIVVAPKIVSSQYNGRVWAKRNEILRGTIYDKNMKVISRSIRTDKNHQKREYEGGAMFAHVLGYLDTRYGITGLERRYDKELSSTNVNDTIKDLMQSKGKKKEKYGNNIKTSLDFNVQQKAYELLGENKGAVVAINPKTGEIIAIVSKPSYDPNNLRGIWASINKDESRPLLNRAVSGLYPPGSTFKTVTAVSALENISGVVDKTFEDNGVLAFNERESLRNFAGESFGSISFKNAYVHSSNVVFGGLGLDLGNDRLKETAEKFYFNKDIHAKDIGIEDSRFPTLKSYQKGEIAQSAIGQATVLATPTEMALVASSVANDGVMMKPYLVTEIMNSDGKTKTKTEPEVLSEVMSKDTAQTMKDLMKGVVAYGTGGAASVDGIQVCGKTGTADHKEEGSGVAPHSWFIGFAPYDNPQIALAVIVEEGGQGGIAAAQIASGVIRSALIK